MKSFVIKISLYLLIFISIIVIGIVLPPTSTDNILFSLRDKMEIAKKTKQQYPQTPIVYWVGGSNVNLGIDSKLISDSLQLPCVNTAVHGGLGLKFEMNNALRIARKNDIIVLMPEYENFWDFNNEMADGQAELLHTIADVYPEGRGCIERDQWYHVFTYLPRYLHDKYIQYFPSNYIKRNKKDLGVYKRHNFDAYGDCILHLGQKPIPFLAMPKLGVPLNYNAIDFLVKKSDECKMKGIQFCILFPAYQQTSYKNNSEAIDVLAKTFHERGLNVYGTPERYVFADSSFYDTYYHLNRQAREIRSILVFQDIRNLCGKK